MKVEYERTFLIAPIEYSRIIKMAPYVRFIEQYYTHISDVDEEKYLKITNIQTKQIILKYSIKKTVNGQRYEDKKTVPVEEFQKNKHRQIGVDIIRKLYEYQNIGFFVWIKPFENFMSAEVEFDSQEEMDRFVFPFKAIDVTQYDWFRSKRIALDPEQTMLEVKALFQKQIS